MFTKSGILFYFILTRRDFLLLRLKLCLGSSKTLPYVFKKYHKNERHLWLLAHFIAKLSQNKYLIIKQILIYQYVRCDCKLWNAIWFYCVFGYFHTLLTIINVRSSEYIHQNFTDYMSSQYTYFYMLTIK